MSRYTYVGAYRNPTEGFFVKDIGDHFKVWVRSDRAADGSCDPDRRHTSAPRFEGPEDAQEWIDGLSESFEEDYDSYLEENRYELAQMERYEAFRNEY